MNLSNKTVDPDKTIIVTCPFCEDVFTCETDGILHYCKCGKVGIDHTRSYTRVLGISREDYPRFQKLNSLWQNPLPAKS